MRDLIQLEAHHERIVRVTRGLEQLLAEVRNKDVESSFPSPRVNFLARMNLILKTPAPRGGLTGFRDAQNEAKAQISTEQVLDVATSKDDILIEL